MHSRPYTWAQNLDGVLLLSHLGTRLHVRATPAAGESVLQVLSAFGFPRPAFVGRLQSLLVYPSPLCALVGDKRLASCSPVLTGCWREESWPVWGCSLRNGCQAMERGSTHASVRDCRVRRARDVEGSAVWILKSLVCHDPPP